MTGDDSSNRADDTAARADVDDASLADVDDASAALSDDDPDEAVSAPQRSPVSDELDVPDEPPDPATADHVLPDEKLRYPEFAFEAGSMASDGGFALERSLGRESMREWLADLRGGLASHDVAVSTPTDVAVFGVGGGDVSMSFDPDDDHRGTLEVTFSLDAKLLAFSDDPDERRAGARGGAGFVPLEMLASDRDPSSFRCYNWIEEPIDDGPDVEADDDPE